MLAAGNSQGIAGGNVTITAGSALPGNAVSSIQLLGTNSLGSAGMSALMASLHAKTQSAYLNTDSMP